MTQTICRVYATRRKAEAAADKLRLNGYGTVDVFGDAEGAPIGADGHVTAMMRAGVPRHLAGEYARLIGSGNTVVGVYAPFGRGYLAEQLLKEHGPLDLDPPRRETMFDDATPMSNILGIKPLSEGKLPFEELTGVRSLASGWTLSGMFGLGFGRAKPAPFSSMFGLPTLTKGATPLTSMTGMKTLVDNPTPLSSAVGMPVLRQGTFLT
ncbi:hypothetical protein [Elioraea sp.]|uniref:hypothetical protein n=1 Tax=Elioraea sp. TaxID=2185103 RepID=UPI0025B7F970|nr:hypothetical protein [Elioraea sp.]